MFLSGKLAEIKGEIAKALEYYKQWLKNCSPLNKAFNIDMIVKVSLVIVAINMGQNNIMGALAYILCIANLTHGAIVDLDDLSQFQSLYRSIQLSMIRKFSWCV